MTNRKSHVIITVNRQDVVAVNKVLLFVFEKESDNMMIQSANTRPYNAYTNQMKRTEEKKEQDSKKLSSGRKVNTAADDAAALAISNKLIKEINTLNQGSSNIQSGINVTQIADGAMQSVSENLMDVEANAIQAMNGTMSADDRAIIQQSTNASLATIDHVSDVAQYNEKKLLDGSNSNMNIYTGTSSEMLSNTNMKIEALGLQDFSLENGNPDLKVLDNALTDNLTARSKMGAQANGLEAANRVNRINAENMTAAESRLADTEMEKAVIDYKKESTLSSVQDMMLKKKMEQDERAKTEFF